MLYIIVALKAEAQAFVDKYKLKKNKLDNLTIFSSDSIRIVISGLGIQNSKKATEAIFKHFSIDKDDTFLNIGICGASTNYRIGELIEIGQIEYNDKIVVIHKNIDTSIVCLNHEETKDRYNIVDMESYGFYEALVNKAVKFYIFKVVSDNFEPKSVTKELAKRVVSNSIDEIMKRLDNAK